MFIINILESIILLPITILGWFLGALFSHTRGSVAIASADYGVRRVHDYYKKTL